MSDTHGQQLNCDNFKTNIIEEKQLRQRQPASHPPAMISSFGALAQGSLQLIKRLSLQGMEGMIKESTDPEEQAIRHAFKTCGFAYSVAGNTLLSSDIRSSLSTPFGLDRTNSSASASTLLPRTLSEEIRLDSSFARDDELVQMEINSYVSEIWNTQTKKMHAVADVEP
ncbi:hypothetical protein BC829DRAFT_232392 [Chytridium lagenaria]|nr:hypothetical protein BC829DRAFT_232392 [Chytridium lagenaria]